MPIDIKIEGDPESIRSAGRWLRSSLSGGVEDCTTQVYRARGDSEGGWQGEAGNAFRGKMTSGGKSADELTADTDRAGQSFEVYADDLQTARSGMQRARQIALDGGLEVTDTQILEPGAAPTVPAGAEVTPQMAQAHETALAAHQQKVTAYNAAAGEANRAFGILDAAKGHAQGVWKDFWGKRYFNAADFVNGTIGQLAARHKSILLKESDRLLEESKLARQRYLRAPGGSPEARMYTQHEFEKANAAEKARARALSVGRRFGSKIPIIGLGITAAGVGYDIHTGKPPGKAIISGAAGALGAAGAGLLVGALVSNPIGWGVVAGIAGGALVGYGAEKLYDALPDNVTNKIEEGTKAVGNAIAGGAKKVWDSIF